MKPDKPVIIKVGSEGAYVNINNVVSIGVVKGMTHQRVKEGWAPTAEQPQPDVDNVEKYQADTIIFYFIGGSELAFKKGEDVDEDSYGQVEGLIGSLVYDERKPVSKPASKGAE